MSRDKALKEAQARITELEKTLKDLQKALELKGQPGGAQRWRTAGKAPEPAKAEPPKAAVAPPAPACKAPEPPKAANRRKVEPPKAEAPKAEPPKAAVPAPAPSRRRRRRPPRRPRPRPMPPRRRPKESSLFDDLFGSTPGWVIGGGAFAALAGVAALIAARRRRTVKFEDSIIGGTDIKTNTVFGSTGGGVVNTGENSLATDFSREGLGSIDTDEVDPIAEAEVYLAYGRDAQAEEILKDALKKDPQRQEIYLKLLEIHAQHNKPSAFETVAAELYSVSQGKGEAWQKAVTLGRQLDPNNPMFGEGAGAAAAAARGRGRRHAAPRMLPPRPERARDVPRSGGGTSSTIAKELEGDNALDFRFDEDVSISRTGNTTRAQIEAIDAAEREFEESAKDLAGGGKPAGRGSAAGLRSHDRRRTERHRGASPSSDLDFRLDPHTGGMLDEAAAKLSQGRARFAGARAAAGGDRSRQARPRVRPRARDVRGPDALGARRAMARCRDQARSRQGLPGNGRRRRRPRNPAGSAARGRRDAESRSPGAAREARLSTHHGQPRAAEATSAARFHAGCPWVARARSRLKQGAARPCV